jgi:hypothetical protein
MYIYKYARRVCTFTESAGRTASNCSTGLNGSEISNSILYESMLIKSEAKGE